ncbi:hypothetical protein M5K25_020135 [Dendrobium thyrsiflorum]|uniref:Uncharacterized protein n=1 Tax=Dendrobium thyrsiflorum TaxID=117978 RepID=A0ABD0UGH6_DENTH
MNIDKKSKIISKLDLRICLSQLNRIGPVLVGLGCDNKFAAVRVGSQWIMATKVTLSRAIPRYKFKSSAKDSAHRQFKTAFQGVCANDQDDQHECIPCHMPLGAEAPTTGQQTNNRLKRRIFNSNYGTKATRKMLLHVIKHNNPIKEGIQRLNIKATKDKGPQGEIITKKLHYKSAVFVRFLSKGIKFSDRFVKCLITSNREYERTSADNKMMKYVLDNARARAG